MARLYRPGEDAAGAVVVLHEQGKLVKLRCYCDATFDLVWFQVAEASNRGWLLRCPGCRPRTAKVNALPTYAPGVVGDVLRMRAEGYGYHAISMTLNIDRNKVYKIIKNAGEIKPRCEFRATKKLQPKGQS